MDIEIVTLIAVTITLINMWVLHGRCKSIMDELTFITPIVKSHHLSINEMQEEMTKLRRELRILQERVERM